MTKQIGPMRSFQRFRALSSEAQGLLVGTCFAKLGASMIWPFIAVMMSRQFGMGIAEIGTVLSAGLFVTIFGSPFGGILTDKFDRRHLVLLALVVVILSYVSMAVFSVRMLYIVGILLISMANCVVEPTLRAALGEMVSEDADRRFIFHLRYYLVNLGVAAGPLIGMWFVEQNSSVCFWLAAVCYGPLLWNVAMWAGHYEQSQVRDGQVAPSVLAVLQSVLGNRVFLTILIINFALVFIYAQTEDPLTFYLIDLDVADLTWIIAMLTVANTGTVLVFHLMFMDQISEMTKSTAFAVGGLFLMASLMVVALNTQALMALWVLAIVLGTVAEFIVMPTITVMVDVVAPRDMRSSFFGIAMLPGLGAALAPSLGAAGILALGGAWFFAGMAALCIPVCLLSLYFARRIEVPA